MITNGTLKFKIVKGGGLNESSEPIPVTNSWSTPVKCFIKTNTHSNKGKYADGVFTVSSYEVYIENQDFNTDRVMLIYDRGENLGEFQVQDIQYLQTVERLKITV